MALQTLGLTLPEIRGNPNISQPLSTPYGFHWLGSGLETPSSEVVTPQTSLQLATVTACVNLISNTVAFLPLILYERNGSGKKIAFDNPVSGLLQQPSDESTSAVLWQVFMLSVLLHGNGYLEISRNPLGIPNGLYFLNPLTTTPRRVAGELVYECTDGATIRQLKASDVIHVPAFVSILNGIVGASVIEHARNVFGEGLALDRFSSKFFANYATPAIALTTTKQVKAEDKYKMRADWEALQSGDNQHRVAVLDQDLDIKVLSVSPQQAMWIEAKAFSRQQICGMFGVHPSQIGDTSRVAGETYAGQQLTYLRDCISFWLVKIQQELLRKLLPGQSQRYVIKHDTRELLRMDPKTQAETAMTLRQAGALTTGEARELGGYEPLDNAELNDLVIGPVNMTALQNLMKPPAFNPASKDVSNE